MFNRILIFIGLIGLFGCEKETTIIKEVEKEYNWKKHAGFNYDNVVQLNSFATSDGFYILGTDYFSNIDQESSFYDTINYFFSSFYLPVDLTTSIKFPISKDFIVLNTGIKSICIGPTKSPFLNNYKYVNIERIDSSFREFDLIYSHNSECFAINNSRQVFIPYLTKAGSVQGLLIDVDSVSSINYFEVDTIKTKIIKFPDVLVYGLLSLNCINDNFYLSTSEDTYRIDKEGNVENVIEQRIYKAFEFEGIIYALCRNNVFLSSDNGKTFVTSYEIPSDFLYVDYTRIGNKLIGYYRQQIFEIFPSINGIYGVELDNNGLENILITSISEFREKIFVTTFSGVYYKEKEDFFKEKTMNIE